MITTGSPIVDVAETANLVKSEFGAGASSLYFTIVMLARIFS
jgi:hypothetical protein